MSILSDMGYYYEKWTEGSLFPQKYNTLAVGLAMIIGYFVLNILASVSGQLAVALLGIFVAYCIYTIMEN